jgi:hypothetical protein
VHRAPLATGAVLAVLGVLAVAEAWRLRDPWPGARLMPAVVGATLLVLAAAHARMRAAPAAWPDAAGWRRVVAVYALLAGYAAALPWLGFLTATALLALAMLRCLGDFSWGLTLVLTTAIAVASDLVFVHWLGMPLPAGPLGL